MQLDRDLDFTILESLDWQPACESILCEEQNGRVLSAEWIVRRMPCKGCGRNPIYFCGPCKDYTLTLVGLPTHCGVCLTVQSAPFRVYSVERLNAA